MFMNIHDKIMSIQICIVTVVLNILCIILFSCMSNNKSDKKHKFCTFFCVTVFEFKISTLLNLNNNTKHDLKFQYNFAHLFFNKYVYFCMLSLSQKFVSSKILINILVFDLLIKKNRQTNKITILYTILTQ